MNETINMFDGNGLPHDWFLIVINLINFIIGFIIGWFFGKKAEQEKSKKNLKRKWN